MFPVNLYNGFIRPETNRSLIAFILRKINCKFPEKPFPCFRADRHFHIDQTAFYPIQPNGIRVQPMVVTLALLIGVRGVAQVLNDAKIFYLSGENAAAYKSLGTMKLFGKVPVQIIPIILAVGLTYFILEKTVLGRYIQAVGDNPKSATLAGINTARTLMFVYMASAVLAALAGIFDTAKIGAADGNSLGLLAELDAIAAVAVGGTSMSGGRAKVFGSVIGALIMQLITISVNMNNITYEYAQVMKALIIIFAVYIQREKTT